MFGYKLVKKKDLRELENKFMNFQSFVFDNCSMVDSKGKSESPYDKKEVESLWGRYDDKLTDVLNKLRGL